MLKHFKKLQSKPFWMLFESYQTNEKIIKFVSSIKNKAGRLICYHTYNFYP